MCTNFLAHHLLETFIIMPVHCYGYKKNKLALQHICTSNTEILLSSTDVRILLWQQQQKETRAESKIKVFSVMIHGQTALFPLYLHIPNFFI